MMVCLIQCGAHQIVHGGIDNHEIFLFAAFHILHACQQRAGIADQTAAGFQHQRLRPSGQKRLHGGGVCGQIGALFVLISNTDATAQIDVFQYDALPCQTVSQLQQAFAGFD